MLERRFRMSSLTWVFRNFSAAEGTAGAITFLNEPDRQGPGAARATALYYGSVRLFFLAPRSLGTGTQQAWVFRNFSAAEGTAGAITFLNEPDRRGAGEARGTAR